jgi:hypothetical protein
MSVGDTVKQSVSFVFNALAVGRAEPFLFRVRPYPNLPVLLDVLAADCTLQEIVTAETEISDHPIETSGRLSDVVADNARNRPIELRVDGIVTDTPIRKNLILEALQSIPPAYGFSQVGAFVTGLGAVASLLSSSIITSSQQAYDALLKLHDQKQLVTLVTPRRAFESMMMTSLIITRDQHTGEALRFGASFKQVVTVSLRTTLVPDLAQASRDLGSQGTAAAPAALKAKSTSTLYDWTLGGKLPKPSRN